MPDVLERPEVGRVFAALDDRAPIPGPLPLPKYSAAKRSRTRRRLYALAALLLVIPLLETSAVFRAKGVLADADPFGEPVVFDTRDVTSDVAWDPSHDDSYVGVDNELYAVTGSGLWRWDGSGWVNELEGPTGRVGRSFLGAGEAGGANAMSIRSVDLEADEAVYSNEIWRAAANGPWGSAASPATTAGFLAADGSSYVMVDVDGVAWSSTDALEWTEVDVPGLRRGSVDLANGGDTTLLMSTPYDDIEFLGGVATSMWRNDGDGFDPVDLPSLRSLGFGYVLGGFRLPDGIEDVVAGDNGYLAYTGGLQIWDGFDRGTLILEPREAWSALMLTSADGTDWDPQVIAGIALYEITPVSGGYLAWATARPASDTVTITDDDLFRDIEVAVSPTPHLAYSTDGLVWSPVVGFESDGRAIDDAYRRDIVPAAGGAYVVIGRQDDVSLLAPTVRFVSIP